MKSEVGSTESKSSGAKNNLCAQAQKSAEIKYKTAEFLVNGGVVERVEFGTMKTDVKGTTALRINHEKMVDGFKIKQDA